MATYLQFLNGHRKGERKRAYWICGPERRLVEEVVDLVVARIGADEFNSVKLFASETKSRDIWAALDQLPLGDDRRLVVVREAEQIVNWQPLASWWDEPALRPVHAVFVSGQGNTDTSADHMRLFVERGKFVRCGPFREPERDKKDQRVEVFRTRANIGIGASRLLLERTRGRMGPAIDFLAKCAVLTNGEVDERLVRGLVATVPADDYVEALVAMRSRDAFAAARAVPVEEYSPIIGRLDWELGSISRLYRAMRKTTVGRDMRQLAKSSGLEPFVVARLLPYARRYDQVQVRTCIQALAMADSRVTDGETDLVLETLTAIWTTRLG